MASVLASRCQSDCSLKFLCTSKSLDASSYCEILHWLATEVHHDFNTTVPRILALKPDVQTRMGLYVGWLISESKALRLMSDIESLVQRVSTSLRSVPDAACPMLAAIWRALEESLCIDQAITDVVVTECATAHGVEGANQHLPGVASQTFISTPWRHPHRTWLFTVFRYPE